MMRFLFILLFPIFAYSQTIKVCKIDITGNKKTHPKIILRELTFRAGDTLNISDLKNKFQSSKDNLLNTSLFNFAEIDSTNLQGDSVTIKINVVERWYLWPIPIFEQASRNFNTWFYEKDFDKINYGFFLAQANFRGRNELLRMIVRRGYREQYGFAYSVPGLGKKQQIGAEVKFLYYRQHKVSYNTVENKPVYFSTDFYNYKNLSASANITYRPAIYNWQNFEISYNEQYITDTLFKVNPSFIWKNKINTNYFSISYVFTRDKRNANYYPLTGYYTSFLISKTGLGILKNEIDFFTINLKFSKYVNIHKRFYYSVAAQTEYSNIKNYSTLFTHAFGYKYFTKGMELYLIDGNGFGLLNNSFRYELIKKKTINFKKIKAEKFTKFHFAFYLSLNADAGYVVNQMNVNMPHSNEFLYGYGAGIDFVTYYDIVFRFEYSINKFGEKGLFLHFNAPF